MKRIRFGHDRGRGVRAVLLSRLLRATAPVAARFLLFATAPLVLAGTAWSAMPCGDVDCSGSVLASDALLVLQTAVGIDTGAQCECSPTTTTTTLAPACPAVDVSSFTDKLAAARCVAYSPSGDWNPDTG